jgi:hypothetical protein
MMETQDYNLPLILQALQTLIYQFKDALTVETLADCVWLGRAEHLLPNLLCRAETILVLCFGRPMTAQQRWRLAENFDAT